MVILTLNCGSSSAKYQVYDWDNKEVMANGVVERIGIDGSCITHKAKGQKIELESPCPTHKEAIELIMKEITDKEVGVISDMSQIGAVGHRVLHGGDKFTKSVLITPEVLDTFRSVVDLGPLHMPANIMGINASIELFGKDVPQVAVFDNAFHSTMPAEAYTFAIPYELTKKYSIRRYGFHGTSHKFVSARCAEVMGKNIEDLKIVTCHLGNGSSITAVKNGKVIDTTMGLTPLDGLAMGTRCGAIDPSVVLFIMEKEGLSVKEMDTLLNKKSGLKGVSELSSDDRDLKAAAAEGNEQCLIARSILAYQIKKYIGAFAAAMNGIDAIVFTGGIGENADDIRDKVCNELSYLGIEINNEIGKTLVKGKEGELSTENSKVKVYVLPTNEELAIARDTRDIVNAL